MAQSQMLTYYLRLRIFASMGDNSSVVSAAASRPEVSGLTGLRFIAAFSVAIAHGSEQTLRSRTSLLSSSIGYHRYRPSAWGSFLSSAVSSFTTIIASLLLKAASMVLAGSSGRASPGSILSISSCLSSMSCWVENCSTLWRDAAMPSYKYYTRCRIISRSPKAGRTEY